MSATICIARRGGNGPSRSSTSRTVSPSTYSITMYGTGPVCPAVSPVSYTATIAGWFNAAALRTSRWNRARTAGSPARSARNTFTATSRPRRSSRPRYTSDTPPRPIRSPSRYRFPNRYPVITVLHRISRTAHQDRSPRGADRHEPTTPGGGAHPDHVRHDRPPLDRPAEPTSGDRRPPSRMTPRTFNPLSSTTKPVQPGWAGQAKVAIRDGFTSGRRIPGRGTLLDRVLAVQQVIQDGR